MIKIIPGLFNKSQSRKEDDPDLITDKAVEEEMKNYYEANIIKVNKTDGIHSMPVEPNKILFNDRKQLNKLDIVIEKYPAGKAGE